MKEVKDLLDESYLMAKKLLLEFKEFYPIAFYLTNANEVINDLNNYDNDEFPISENSIRLYENIFKKKLSNENIKGFTITYDCVIQNEYFPNKIDAIAIKLYEPKKSCIYYFPYKLEESDIIYYEGWIETIH